MLFNSLEFLVFLPVVFCLYWFVFKQLKAQNLFVVAASYLFYGWWDWRFLLLITFTSLCSFASGLLIEHYPQKARRKAVVAVNLIINLGILGLFKYYNFFIDSFYSLLETLTPVFTGAAYTGSGSDLAIQIILPAGISFYTFQALSYSIDVYRRQIPAARDVVEFLAFVSFFPQLVAGPIERATNLLPQFQRPRTFDYTQAVDGAQQMLWGFFKKMVVADNCAPIANQAFAALGTPAEENTSLLIGAVAFTFQIYCDFSGYSDIAIGTARLFGIRLKNNFLFPYFSRDMGEFWRRWHISLNTWFKDYLYIPLGGSRGGRMMTIRNTFIIFTVSGLWHGANWTFVVWGMYNAALFIPLALMNRNRRYTRVVAEDRHLPSPVELVQMLATFALAVIGWVIFRAESIGQAMTYLGRMFTRDCYTLPHHGGLVAAYIALMLVCEWIFRRTDYGLSLTSRCPKGWRITIFIVLLLVIEMTMGKPSSFIYFQF